MSKKISLNLLFATALHCLLFNSVDIRLPTSNQAFWNPLSLKAEARSSGGRSSGGSFSRGSSRSSGSRSSSGSFSRSGSHRSYSTYHYYNGYRSSSSNASAQVFFAIVFFGVLGIIAFLLVLRVLQHSAAASKGKKQDNSLVALSKVQVALLAQAKGVQSALTELSLNVNTNTERGLGELLQESALLLLRYSEYWSHGLARSESIPINRAEQAFNRLSVTQRSKFSTETFTNVEGKIHQKEAIAPDNEVAAYIVVTLLVGTVHQQPLFKTIHSTEELQTALEQLAALSFNDLLKFELLWTPQTEADSLTYDELLSEYTDMIQLV